MHGFDAIEVAILLGLQTVGLIIWLTKLGFRVAMLETRGTDAAAVQFEAIRARLTLIEERQRLVIEHQTSIFEELRKLHDTLKRNGLEK